MEPKLIQPAPVQRDENGNWFHPELPAFAGTDEAGPNAPKWEDWIREQGLKVCRFDLEDEDKSHPAYVNYWGDNQSADISAWNPVPHGNGWFLLAIGDTEDGPLAWFARRTKDK